MSRLSHSLRLSRWTLLPVLVVCCSIAPGDQVTDGDRVAIGIEGHYRVGRWTGIRVSGELAFTSVETRDGDGVQVAYEQPNRVAQDGWAYVIPGSEAAPLVLRDENDVIASTRLPTIGSPSRGPAMIPLTMPWIVAFGDPLGVEQIGANKLLDRDALIAVSMPRDASGFPDSVLGYDGVDMMLLGGSSADSLASLSRNQQQAIARWITDGGRVFLTLGQSAPELMQAAPWLQRLLPFEELTTVKIDPSSIETYTSSQTPLNSFVGVKLPKRKGRVLILGRTTRRASTPIAVDYNVGFGRITVVAADLESETFATWPERLDLIRRLTGTILITEQKEQNQKSRATAYDDVAGQLPATLDQFAIKRNYGFSVVSLILMALITAIGPLDYLLINRFLGRPLLGWVSFPLIAIGLSALLVSQARPVAQASSSSGKSTSPDAQTLHGNHIEIFDVDSIAGIGRGFAVSYLYTHEAYRMDLAVKETESLSSFSNGVELMLTTAFGYPGESYGGIQIAIEDGRLPLYQVPFQHDDSGKSVLTSTSLRGLPLASRSSKGIATRCSFKPKLATEVSLQHRPGSELLQGELINPLPLDLLDGMLIFRNWAYLLPTRFPANGRIASVDSLRQKNFRWRLSRQKSLDRTTETEAWDPTMRDSPVRVAEMLMFHDAVGGARYTSLRNDPLSFLDLSHVLTEDRCILIGKVASPLTRIEVNDQSSTRQPSGTTLSLVRVVLPVKSYQRH